MVGLQDGRVEVGNRRPRRRDDRRGPHAHLGQTEREEASRALIDPHMQSQAPSPVRRLQLVCERRRPRPRRQDDVPHSPRDEPVDDSTSQSRRRIHVRDCVTSALSGDHPADELTRPHDQATVPARSDIEQIAVAGHDDECVDCGIHG